MKRIAALVCLLFLLAQGAAAETWGLNKEGDTVRQIQECLTTLGYYGGKITGHFGDMTRAAVKAYQKKQRLVPDGVMTEKLLSQLIMEAALKSEEAPAPAVTESPAAADAAPEADAAPRPEQPMLGTRTLRQGMTGEDVLALQSYLQANGFYKGSLTGRFGSLTRQAVRKLQKSLGLSADGVAGPKTLAGIGVRREADTSAPAASPASGGNSGAGATLRYGVRGDAVSALQDALRALGYFDTKTTGYYGRDTRTAVRKYQAARKLTADGVAGPKTLRQIDADLNEKGD